MAMRDPSHVAAKADIHQQAVKGGDVPIATPQRPATSIGSLASHFEHCLNQPLVHLLMA
jgi:hypothetical protein